MKTIEDAYEELNGDLNNTYFWDATTKDAYLFFKEGHIDYICDNSRETEEGAYQYICTVDEFNNYKPTKAVTHEGKVYQIGAVYEFSDDGKWWQLGVLNNYDAKGNSLGGKFQSKAGNKTEWFKHIRLQQAPVGTITEAPVDLTDGDVYSIDVHGEKGLNAIYRKPCPDGFATFAYKHGMVNKELVSNIKPLTVAK